MTREDHALALLSDANPVPDERRYALGSERRAHLDAVEQWSDTMTDTQLRQVEPPQAGRPRWLMGALAALLVLVLGTVAVLVMRDEPEPAAAPAPQPTVTYESDDCLYDGPTEFAFGDSVTMVLINNTDTFGGVTIYFIREGTFLPDDGDYPMWFGDEFFEKNASAGESAEFVVSPSVEAGNWVVVCGTTDAMATPQTPNIDRYATIIRFAP